MRIAFRFGDDDKSQWREFDAVPRIGDVISFEAEWYLVGEVRWVLTAAAGGMGENYVIVFADKQEVE